MHKLILLSILISGAVFVNPLMAQTLRATFKETGVDTISVAIFADGNISEVIAKSENARTTSGSLGVSVGTAHSDFTVLINVAGTSDTLRDNFGASLLAPATGSTFNAGLVDYRRHNVWKSLGAHGYASVTSSRWAARNTETGQEQTYGVTVLGFGLSAYKEVIGQDVSGTFVAVLIDGGIAYRGIYGDIANKENNMARSSSLGSSSEHFLGLEVGLSLQINAIKAGLTFYFFDTDARGFSDGQVVAGFSIQSNILSTRTARKK